MLQCPPQVRACPIAFQNISWITREARSQLRISKAAAVVVVVLVVVVAAAAVVVVVVVVVVVAPPLFVEVWVPRARRDR